MHDQPISTRRVRRPCSSPTTLTAHELCGNAQVETVSGFAAHHFSGSASSEGVKPRARVNCVAKELAGLAVTAFPSLLRVP